MKAMVLAAGLGTRLRPLTDTRPKALVELNGRSLLEIALVRLRDFGVGEVIVNVHHYADTVIEYLRSNRNFGMRIEISREEVLLDTGGGLKKAAWFFLEESPHREEPLLLHNVDVLSTIDFAAMLQLHNDHDALATLAVQQRPSSRYLLFDSSNQLCGRRFEPEQHTEFVGRAGSSGGADQMQPLAFSGIHVISPRLFTMMPEEGAFPIIENYLRLAGEGERILSFRADSYSWRDLGTQESLRLAAEEMQSESRL